MKQKGIDIALSTPMNLNDPAELAASLQELAFNLKALEGDYHRDGVWLEQVSKGFVLAMAEAKRGNWSVDDQISAAVNAFGLFLALMVGAACGDKEDATTATLNVCSQLSKTIFNLVLENQRNALPCGKDGSAEKIYKH
jgi:hypothetical protein